MKKSKLWKVISESQRTLKTLLSLGKETFKKEEIKVENIHF